MRISLHAAALLLLVPATFSAQNSAPNLTDPEVAHVAVTANSIDIDLGKLALSKAASAAVKGFAQSMVDAHTAVNARAADLAGKLGVTPADNAVSRSLQKGAAQARTDVEKLTGPAFDRAYIAREVGFHEAVLGALDQVLIPTTENAELKRLLVEARAAVATHLTHAQMVAKGLATAESRD